jgi:hypothetical protein
MLKMIIAILLFATTLPLSVSADSEVQVEGALRINPGGYIIYPDSTMQTTASTPTWSQLLSAERFVLVLGNTAVLDNETGLVWERSTDATKFNWVNAQGRCYQLNLGGRRGWRLPSVEELSSLVDPAHTNPSLPTGHPFTNVQNDGYWSSTMISGDGNAWYVFFSYGTVYGYVPSGTYYVRCVRAGK